MGGSGSKKGGGTATLYVTAVTSAIGSGYHVFLCELLRALGEDLGIEWTGDPDDTAADDTGFWLTADREALDRAMFQWLASEASAARYIGEQGLERPHIGIEPGVRFEFEGAVATLFGPRDNDWIERVETYPAAGIHVFPWWTDDRGATFFLNRALTRMWTEVRWREPLLPGEDALQDVVINDLEAAWELDPELDYPWPEWGELARYRDRKLPAKPDILPLRPLIGYRRRPITVIYDGWQIRVPGTFAEEWFPGSWWSGDKGRDVEIKVIESERRSAQELIDNIGKVMEKGTDPSDLFSIRVGEVLGRGHFFPSTAHDEDVTVLRAISAVNGSAVGLHIMFTNPDQRDWAIETWKTLKPAR